MRCSKKGNTSPNEPDLPDSERKRKPRGFDSSLVIRPDAAFNKASSIHDRAHPRAHCERDQDAIAVRSGCFAEKAFDAKGIWRHRCALWSGSRKSRWEKVDGLPMAVRLLRQRFVGLMLPVPAVSAVFGMLVMEKHTLAVH